MIEHGKLTELGSHDELVALGGTYNRLYRMQFGEDKMELGGAEDVVATGVEGTA